MNRSVVAKKNPLVSTILCFSILIFVLGTILFFKSDYENKALKKALLTDGIRTKGYIRSKSKEENRRLSINSSNWQYSNTHFIIFEYQHLMEAEEDKLSLGYHLSKDKDSKSTAAPAKSMGKLESQSLVNEALYNKLQLGESIDIIYLAGVPSSVRVLNTDGGVDIPMLAVFSYICLFLTIGSICSFCFYLKTGRTF